MGRNPLKNVRMHSFLRPWQKGKMYPNVCSLSCRRHKTLLLHLDGLLNSITIASYSLLVSSWPLLDHSRLWRAIWERWGPLLRHNIICWPRLVEFTELPHYSPRGIHQPSPFPERPLQIFVRGWDMVHAVAWGDQGVCIFVITFWCIPAFQILTNLLHNSIKVKCYNTGLLPNLCWL